MKHPNLPAIAGLVAVFLLVQPAHAEWPQVRGPGANGIANETISKAWPSSGPRQIWKQAATDGFSSFTVKDGRVFTIVKRTIDGAPREVCLALDANTGKELWASALSVAKYDGGGDDGTPDNKGGDGPRSTPTLDGNSAYVLTADLNLFCLDGATGKISWQKDIIKEHAGRNVYWKNAASPLIDGNLVFVGGGGAGQSLIAFNKSDGKVVWKAHDEKITHATPVAATIHGVRQVIFFTQSGLVSVTPKDGSLLWKHPFPFKTSSAASPVVGGDIVYCSAGYGVGAGAAKITKEGDKFVATELWRKPNQLPNHWSTPVYKDGHLYGMFSFKEYGRGPVKCVELATGKEVWSQPGFGPGHVILAGNDVLALSDKGEIVLFEATPAAYKEKARADILDGKCWSTPALSGGRIYARSTKEGVCVDVSAQTASR